MATWEDLQAALIRINEHYHSPLGWRNNIDDPELLRKIIGWQNHHVPGCHVPDELVSDLRGHYPDLFNVKSGEMTTPPAAPAPAPASPPPPPSPGLTAPDLKEPDPKTPPPPGPLKTGEGGDGGAGGGTGGATSPDGDDGFSGRAAETVKQLDAALAKNRSDLNDADDKLADAILNATTSSETGKAKLRALQDSLISQVKKIGPSLDTPAGQQQLAEFLQGKVSEISEVLKDNGLDSAAHAAVLDGLTERFAALAGTKPGTKGDETGGPGGDKSGAGDPPAPGVAPAPPGDLGELGGLPSDPLLASLMPGMGALGSLPGMLSGMLPGGGGGFGMPGGGLPLGDLGSGLGSAIRDARSAEDTGLKDPPNTLAEKVESKEGSPSGPEETKPAGVQGAGGTGEKAAAGTGQVTPVSTPEQTLEGQPAADTVVKLPSGATADAGSALLAKAGRAVLDGTPIDDAYRQSGVNLSPRGAPVTAPVSPSKLVFGDIGQFTDHRIMALGDNRVWVNGREMTLNELQTGPNFLGWERPVVPAAQSQPVLKTSATASAAPPH